MRTKCHSKNSAVFLPPFSTMHGWGLQETARAGKFPWKLRKGQNIFAREFEICACSAEREAQTERQKLPRKLRIPFPPPPVLLMRSQGIGGRASFSLGLFRRSRGKRARLLCCEREGGKGGGLPLKFLPSPLADEIPPLRKGIRRKQFILDQLRFPQCLQDFPS